MSSDDILSAAKYPQTVPITDLSATHDSDIATDDFSDSETDLVINDHLSNINTLFLTKKSSRYKKAIWWFTLKRVGKSKSRI